MPTRASPLRSAAPYAVAALAGAVTGLAGSFLQAARLTVGSLTLPWGVVLALGSSVLVFVGAGLLIRSRRGAFAAGAGWLAAVASVALPRREGDLVLAAVGAVYVWLLGGAVLVGLALAPAYGALAGRLRARVRNALAAAQAAADNPTERSPDGVGGTAVPLPGSRSNGQ